MHIPVVMLSARSGDDATVEGLEAGADDYLVKPFSARELLARVRSNLELDRVRRLRGRARAQPAAARQRRAAGHHRQLRARPAPRTRSGMSPEALRITGFPARRTDRPVRAHPATPPNPPIATWCGPPRRRSAEDGTPIDLELRPAAARRSAGTSPGCGPRSSATSTAGRASCAAASRTSPSSAPPRAQLAAAQADREAAAREHAIASELQRSLLPQRDFVADQLEIASYYRAGRRGHRRSAATGTTSSSSAMGRTALVIGDVMGRGVRAAAVMGQLRAAVRAYARLTLAPAELHPAARRHRARDQRGHDRHLRLRRLRPGRRTCWSTPTPATCRRWSPASGAPTRAHRGRAAPGRRRGTARSARPSMLPPGAMLTLYTDGLVERRGSDIDAGIDRLAEVITTSRVPTAELPAALADALLPDGPDDDVAVLVCRATARPQGERRARHAVGPGDQALADARHFAAEALASWDVSEATRFTVQVAVSELVTNAIRHGARPIEVQLVLHGRRLCLEVRDGGDSLPTLRRSGPDEGSGRGLLIVSTLADGWGAERARTGKTVWCEFDSAVPDADG